MLTGPEDDAPHYTKDYNNLVKKLIQELPMEEAMSVAVGGLYAEMGPVIVNVLKVCGLRDGMSVIDLGCGSGRVAKPLGAEMPNLDYLGLDIVPELLDYAKSQSPATFRFQLNPDLGLPVPDGSVDIIFAFSVFTHLLHEESFLYLEDGVRALKSGGVFVFSFLDSRYNWQIFKDMVSNRRGQVSFKHHLNMLIERPMIEAWAQNLDMEIISSDYGRSYGLGQSVAILKKR
jgi:SAM-dependent methyltransferase